MKTKNKLTLSQGFSLVELLVVIAVIAIIAAIAIPNIANITGQANDAKARRNAQNIASVASAAMAAGYTGHATVALWIQNLTQGNGSGIAVTNGTFVNNFGVSGLSATETSNASSYLLPSGNALMYSATSNASTN